MMQYNNSFKCTFPDIKMETKPGPIENRVLKVIKNSTGQNSISLDSEIELDSLKVVELALGLEDEFNINIPDKEIELIYQHAQTPGEFLFGERPLNTVKKITDYINKKVKAY
jgi:acyl carrier protein